MFFIGTDKSVLHSILKNLKKKTETDHFYSTELRKLVRVFYFELIKSTHFLSN